jgi:hypothetical protein
MRRVTIALFLGLAWGSTTATEEPAHAANDTLIRSLSFNEVAALARDIGWTVEDRSKPDAPQMIIRAPNGIGFWANLLQCSGAGADAPCTLLFLQSVFDAVPTNVVSYANQWNQSKALGRAYLTTQNAYAFDDSITFEGGVTRANIARRLNLISVAAAEFVAAMPK